MSANVAESALVVIDVQMAIDDPVWGPRNNPDAEERIATLLAFWRARSWPVIHVRHDSVNEDSPYRPDQPGNDFKALVAPHEGEQVVAKTTNSAFIGTRLEDILRELGGKAVFVGVLTNNSLEATVRMAGNLGIETYVVSDACWSVDKTDGRGRTWLAEDVHALSLANMHGEYAQVVSLGEIVN